MSDHSPRLTVTDHVAEVRFGDPARRNAMGADFWDGLPGLFAEIDARADVRAVIILNDGPHFTAGIDLDYLQSLMPPDASEDTDPARVREKLRRHVIHMQEAINAVARCRVPVIAAVQGGCIGAGLDLVAAVDMIYASDDAYFTIQETNLGLTADLGSLQRLPGRLPRGLLRELAFTGRPLKAEEALAAGLVTAVSANHRETLAHAQEVAATIATKSPLAVLGTKRALDFGEEGGTVAQGLDYVATWNAGLLSMKDVARSLRAMAGKAAPDHPDLDD